MSNKSKIVDLENKCILTAIYCGIYYNKKTLLKKYEINNIYDFIDLLLNGNGKYKSLCSELNDKLDIIDELWKETLTNLDLDRFDQNFINYYENGNNMLLKINKKIEEGHIYFDLPFYVGIYFNLHFKEITINNQENFVLNNWNNKIILNPEAVITLHTCRKNDKLHQFYKDDFEEIEKGIINDNNLFEELNHFNIGNNFDSGYDFENCEDYKKLFG